VRRAGRAREDIPERDEDEHRAKDGHAGDDVETAVEDLRHGRRPQPRVSEDRQRCAIPTPNGDRTSSGWRSVIYLSGGAGQCMAERRDLLECGKVVAGGSPYGESLCLSARRSQTRLLWKVLWPAMSPSASDVVQLM